MDTPSLVVLALAGLEALLIKALAKEANLTLQVSDSRPASHLANRVPAWSELAALAPLPCRPPSLAAVRHLCCRADCAAEHL